MPHADKFDTLVDRFISEQLTPEELPAFFAFLEEEGLQLRYAERIDADLLSEAWLGWSNEQQHERLYNDILKAGNIPVSKGSQKTATRFLLSNTWWLRSAAAIFILLVGIAIYQFISKQQSPNTAQQQPPSKTIQDIPPGGNKAVLILEDQSVVSLDSLANGATILQGGMKIVKAANGEIHYAPSQNAEGDNAVISNTIKTPPGGQFTLTLADGTKVWLNAASSITYPTSFSDHRRNVSISGEVYFEVAKNKEKPFIVNVGTNNTVEVLGTHFNINSYSDEKTIKTTLLEGKVKVSEGYASVMLVPGQQSSGLTVHTGVDLDQVMAWKNGEFSFEGKTLQEVLRELARWYNLTIIYENDTPGIRLKGGMGKNLNLSQVIKGLESMGVKCRLEPGHRLVVTL